MDTNKDSNHTVVTIPDHLVDQIKKRCQGTTFTSVSSYVLYILNQVISSNQQDSVSKTDTKNTFSEEEEAKVKDVLRNFGYL